MNELAEERVIGLLREGARNVAPDNSASLVERMLKGATDAFFEAESPLGAVYVAVGPGGVRHVASAGSPEEFARGHRERFGRLVSPAGEELVAAWAGRVERALAGEGTVPLDLSGTTPFQRRVLEVVGGIRRGEVRPYVWVAHEAGAPGASRAVGNVMASNPVPLLVPCHRVVRNDGRTGSYAFGADKKVRLLEGEGVPPAELAGAPYVATPTTGVVCHATCPNAKRIRPENRRPFRSVWAAVGAGFRPCKVCRPVVTA